jgi:hypothetical protein
MPRKLAAELRASARRRMRTVTSGSALAWAAVLVIVRPLAPPERRSEAAW